MKPFVQRFFKDWPQTLCYIPAQGLPFCLPFPFLLYPFVAVWYIPPSLFENSNTQVLILCISEGELQTARNFSAMSSTYLCIHFLIEQRAPQDFKLAIVIKIPFCFLWHRENWRLLFAFFSGNIWQNPCKFWTEVTDSRAEGVRLGTEFWCLFYCMCGSGEGEPRVPRFRTDFSKTIYLSLPYLHVVWFVLSL